MTEKRKAGDGDGLLVCAAQCDQCLFSKNKIVSNERRVSILSTIDAADTHFECHKATIQNRHAVCRGDYNRDPLRTTGMRVARCLDAVVFVDENGFVVPDTSERRRR